MGITSIKVGSEWVVGAPSLDGQQYRIHNGNSLNSAFVVLTYFAEHSSTNYLAENVAVNIVPSIGATPIPATKGATENDYHVLSDQAIVISCLIKNSLGDIQTQIDSGALNYPPLVLPLEKTADSGASVVEEIYFQASLVGGSMLCNGKIEKSGNWKISKNRVNKALKAIGADWTIEFPTTTFYVPSI